jgi:hypothetical protein
LRWLRRVVRGRWLLWLRIPAASATAVEAAASTTTVEAAASTTATKQTSTAATSKTAIKKRSPRRRVDNVGSITLFAPLLFSPIPLSLLQIVYGQLGRLDGIIFLLLSIAWLSALAVGPIALRLLLSTAAVGPIALFLRLSIAAVGPIALTIRLRWCLHRRLGHRSLWPG